MNTTNPDERGPEWTAPATELTVGEAEQFEQAGLTWPISGDATTIAANTP